MLSPIRRFTRCQLIHFKEAVQRQAKWLLPQLRRQSPAGHPDATFRACEGCLVVLQCRRAPDAGILLSQPQPGPHRASLQTIAVWALLAFPFWLTFLFHNPLPLLVSPVWPCWLAFVLGSILVLPHSRQTCLRSSSECSLLC